ncbi:hypothetical protein GCM10008995_21770 [Halobellus salinus]|uniref:Uncharacterized protein n=1 Tax=Halobellus salinus TaxID=931585 RepID=A0A830EC42_9EURY|nr:hypothetical protein [Halobellus salinus]GGJ11500.1 hypothetical protein GCM10008995_21770 [Halobellus salinus]
MGAPLRGGGLTPNAGLVIGPVVVVIPDGPVLALVVVAPTATAGLFRSDVGESVSPAGESEPGCWDSDPDY